MRETFQIRRRQQPDETYAQFAIWRVSQRVCGLRAGPVLRFAMDKWAVTIFPLHLSLSKRDLPRGQEILLHNIA